MGADRKAMFSTGDNLDVMLGILLALKHGLHSHEIGSLHLQVLFADGPRNRDLDGVNVVRNLNVGRVCHEGSISKRFRDRGESLGPIFKSLV